MTRLLGAALLLGGGLWLGLGAAGELSRRVRELEGWMAALGRLESELAFRIPDLPHLLEGLSGGAVEGPGAVFSAALTGMERLGERSFREIWHCALETGAGGLNPGDIALLDRLGDILGRYDQDEQRRLIESVRQELDRRLGEARREREQKGRTCGVLGLGLGALGAILLL